MNVNIMVRPLSLRTIQIVAMVIQAREHLPTLTLSGVPCK